MTKRYIAIIYILLSSIIIVFSQSLPTVGYNQISKNCINDRIGIYFAKSNRLPWTINEFEPYVVHQFQDNHKAWFFQCFSFLDLDINGKSLICRKDINTAASKDDWFDFLKLPFTKNKYFDALDRCIETNIKLLGPPPFRHKVVMALPMPYNANYNWGRIGSIKMNFTKDGDRIKALKWYIDTFIDEYNRHSYKNFDLEGFYWLDEDMENNSSITNIITNYVRSKGLTTSWSPYLRAKGVLKWSVQGFDYAYIQAGGYTIKEKFEITRVDEAFTKAKNKMMGVVLEFDGNLYYKPNVFIQRLENTIKKFEDNGVFSDAQMSYYDGGGMIYYINNGSKFKSYSLSNFQYYRIRELMDRIAQHIVNRYTKIYSDKQTSNPYSLQNNNQHDNTSNDDWRNPDYWHF